MNYKNNKNNIIKNKNIDNNTTNQILSKNGYNCLGPCIEADTLFYNPVTFQAIIEDYPSCPIYKKNKHDPKKKDEILLYDRCNIEDNKKLDKNIIYNIFDDDIYFCNISNDFLVEVYNIRNVIDIINFLNDNINELPDYTQKRILNYIYSVYKNHDDFPFELFSEKIIEIFNKIYKIKLNILKVNKKIKTDKIDNIFEYLFTKYSK